MDKPRPVLMLLVPADWDAVPEGLTELRRCLGEDYGASLLRQSTVPMRSPMPLYVGYWPHDVRRFAQRHLRPRIEAAFYSLAWLELEDAGCCAATPMTTLARSPGRPWMTCSDAKVGS